MSRELENKSLEAMNEDLNNHLINSLEYVETIRKKYVEELDNIEYLTNESKNLDKKIEKMKEISIAEFNKLKEAKKEFDEVITLMKREKTKISIETREELLKASNDIKLIFEGVESEKIKIVENIEKLELSNTNIKKITITSIILIVILMCGLGAYTWVVIEKQKKNLEKVDISNYVKNDDLYDVNLKLKETNEIASNNEDYIVTNLKDGFKYVNSEMAKMNARVLKVEETNEELIIVINKLIVKVNELEQERANNENN